jgi:hypothetical protein
MNMVDMAAINYIANVYQHYQKIAFTMARFN